jgi:hypothetical protein
VSERAPCVKCGRLLHTGEGRVLVSFTVAELAELAGATADPAVRSRLLCALSLLDDKRARDLA